MAPSHISSTITPLRALYSVFVQPTISHAQKPSARLTHALPRSHALSRRAFTTTPLRPAKPVKTANRSQKYDKEITANRIQLVDAETNKLQEPEYTSEVLRSLDLKTHRLVQLSAEDPKDPYFTPVCKVVDKKEVYVAERQKKAREKETKNLRAKELSVKTLELNWAIDGNDLDHRLGKVREFLEEGRKVEVVLASKKRGRKASVEECEGLLEKLEGVVDGVTGAKQAKTFEGKLGGFGSLVLQGKAGAVAKEKNVQQKAQQGA